MTLQNECSGCPKIHEDGYCTRYKGQEDRQHTRIGGCAGRPKETQEKTTEFKLNPLKASKRGVKQ